MKISPFEKASVSNIKDLVLTIISIHYFADFAMNGLSEVGIVLCLTASMVFSCRLIEKEGEGYRAVGEGGVPSLEEEMAEMGEIGMERTGLGMKREIRRIRRSCDDDTVAVVP